MLAIANVRCSRCGKGRDGVFLLRDGALVCWWCLHQARLDRSRQRPYASPAEEAAEELRRAVTAFDAMVAARPLKPPGVA